MTRISILFGMLLTFLAAAAWAGPSVRAPILAGTWYPADAIRLSAEVRGMMEQARPPEVQGAVVALIVPHAGYKYSGRTAAAGYKLVQGRDYETVVVLAPSHRHPVSGASVYDRGPYRTPLGEVPLDREYIERLQAKTDMVGHVPQAHAQEHSLEIQLPFLQTALPDFRLVPLVLGFTDPERCRELARALAESARGRRVLLVASTDLSHFHDAAEAEALDARLARPVEAFDPQCLASRLRPGEGQACGAGPLLTAISAARELGARKAVIVARSHSGEVTGDNDRVVGYLSAVLVNPGTGGGETGKDRKSGVLGEEERRMLLDIARASILAGLQNEEYRLPDNLPESLKEPSGAFVTLKRGGQLRGCVGHVVAKAPLAETVAGMARAAAFRDPRFAALKESEFEELEVEISVMSPLQPGSPEEVVVGEHGILMRRGARQGLLLPQVAAEWGWDRETFLSQTCRKAGLAPQCWNDPATEILLFSAEVF